MLLVLRPFVLDKPGRRGPSLFFSCGKFRVGGAGKLSEVAGEDVSIEDEFAEGVSSGVGD